MTRIRLLVTLGLLAAFALFHTTTAPVRAASTDAAARDPGRPQHSSFTGKFTIDVAIDGRTWRMNDGSNPFYPVFTGQLFRGNTFIVSGRIYPGGTLAEGGDFDGDNNPPGPELPGAIGTWVCRGAFNLDIGEIGAGGFPHVISTQVFTAPNGLALMTEGPEGGATLRRAVIGGLSGFNDVRGEVVEQPLGVNTTNLFNLRFHFDLR